MEQDTANHALLNVKNALMELTVLNAYQNVSMDILIVKTSANHAILTAHNVLKINA